MIISQLQKNLKSHGGKISSFKILETSLQWKSAKMSHTGKQTPAICKCPCMTNNSCSYYAEIAFMFIRKIWRPPKRYIGKWSESCSLISNSLQPHELKCPWNSPGQNTGVGSHSVLQGIFPTLESNPGLPHCKWILYQLSHQGSPRILKWGAYPFSKGSSQPRNWCLLHCKWILYQLSYQERLYRQGSWIDHYQPRKSKYSKH